MRRRQELPPRWTEPVPGGSRMDPALAKAEPGGGGGTSAGNGVRWWKGSSPGEPEARGGPGEGR